VQAPGTATSGRTKKKAQSSEGRYRGTESAEISTPCIAWESTTAVGGNLPDPPVIRALLFTLLRPRPFIHPSIHQTVSNLDRYSSVADSEESSDPPIPVVLSFKIQLYV